MKVKPMLLVASLSAVISGCASDPSFNLLPSPLYERGSLQQPAGQNIASAPVFVVMPPTPNSIVNSPSQPTAL